MLLCLLSVSAFAGLAAFLAESGKDLLPVLALSLLPVLLPALAFLARAALAWLAGHALAALFVILVVRNLVHPDGEPRSSGPLGQAGVSSVPLSPEP